MTKHQPIDHALASSLLHANGRPNGSRRIHPKHWIIVGSYLVTCAGFAIGVLAEGNQEGGSRSSGSPNGRSYHNTPHGREVMIVGEDAIDAFDDDRGGDGNDGGGSDADGASGGDSAHAGTGSGPYG